LIVLVFVNFKVLVFERFLEFGFCGKLLKFYLSQILRLLVSLYRSGFVGYIVGHCRDCDGYILSIGTGYVKSRSSG
jgi:hypothetical protein